MKNYIKKITFAIVLILWVVIKSQAQNTLYLGVGSNISKSPSLQKTSNEFAEYLSKKVGIMVKISSLKPGKTLEQIEAGELDMALMNTFGYVLAAAEGNMECLVVVADAQKQAVTYKSCIIANPSTQIKTEDQLRIQASKLVFGFVTASSTSGHLVPRLRIYRLNMSPEASFQEIVFAGSHQELIQKVSTNEIKVGATSYTDLEELIASKKYQRENFNILWISEPITNGPVAVRKTLSASLKAKLKEAWLSLPQENPALNARVVKFWHNTDEKTVFTEGSDEIYDSIKRMSSSIEEITLLVNYYTE